MTADEIAKATENLDAALAKAREAAIAALDAKIAARRIRAVAEARATREKAPPTVDERAAYGQAEDRRIGLEQAADVAWVDVDNAVDDLRGYGCP